MYVLAWLFLTALHGMFILDSGTFTVEEGTFLIQRFVDLWNVLLDTIMIQDKIQDSLLHFSNESTLSCGQCKIIKPAIT